MLKFYACSRLDIPMHFGSIQKGLKNDSFVTVCLSAHVQQLTLAAQIFMKFDFG